jgi:hypothetical protein
VRGQGAALADDLEFDPVVVVKVKPFARLIIRMAARHESGGNHPRFGSVQILDHDADMVQPAACAIA